MHISTGLIIISKEYIFSVQHSPKKQNSMDNSKRDKKSDRYERKSIFKNRVSFRQPKALPYPTGKYA